MHPSARTMNEPREGWVAVATYGAVWEADFAVETLREAGIPAWTEGGQHLGIFGPGYAGASMRGVRVRVPWHRAEEARDILGLEDDEDPDAPDSLP
jgi:hypothetical protein